MTWEKPPVFAEIWPNGPVPSMEEGGFVGLPRRVVELPVQENTPPCVHCHKEATRRRVTGILCRGISIAEMGRKGVNTEKSGDCGAESVMRH